MFPRRKSPVICIASSLVAFVLCVASEPARAKLVRYNFDIDRRVVNITGQEVRAMAIDGRIPGPTITARVGDTLEVVFNNKMDVETSIHWHGVLLPNDQDGVPYLTTQPIAAGGSLTYRYPVIHAGTYWYHAHTGLQEQRGLYGALVFHPKKRRQRAARAHIVVFSDWIDDDPAQAFSNLKKDGDYYLKKAGIEGHGSMEGMGHMEHMGHMDSMEGMRHEGVGAFTDIVPDALLVNGAVNASIGGARKGETILLRLVNAAASSYFDVAFAGGDMTIIAADGVDVKPKRVSHLRMAMAETFDVLVRIPDNKAYELRAQIAGGERAAVSFLGRGEKVRVAQEDTAPVPYAALSPVDADRTPQVKARNIVLRLTGGMAPYEWSFNGRVFSDADKILIRKGERVRFTLVNTTMMHHPLHLHGHFFRIVTGDARDGILKHTINVPPMQTAAIEFDANAEKDWFFHCHNLYHMKAGMALIVSYGDDKTPDPDLIDKMTK